MKKTMSLLPLLFSVNAFALENPCANGCTLQQIEAYNKANYKTTEQILREADELEADMDRRWLEEKRKAEERRDALPPPLQKEPGQQLDNCVYRFYEEASEIVGYNVKQYVSVGELESGKCTFDIQPMADEMCDYFDSFSSLATPNWQVAEWCRYEAEKRAITEQYHDVFGTPAFTDSVKKELKTKLTPVEIKHSENIKRLFEIEKKRAN
ncbi:hypothetical protein ACQZ2G_06300 [Pseudomonas viridiflava]|uniref:hypothetical protein n=1 Tax=Pseudomonas viridiflava TaxID=33069 RepID=UPI003D27FD07